MVEIAYHSQYQYFQFPPLRTQKTECTKEQIDAIDDLIDSMDLTISTRECDEPRDTYRSDLLPFESLSHIYEQNVLDVLERKIISNASEDDEQFAEMLDDKNFVEIFWKVPEMREKNAKRAVKVVKSLFPLEEYETENERNTTTKVKSELSHCSGTATDSSSALSFDRISEDTPAEDFQQLINHNVLKIDNRTERDVKYQFYAKQMRNVIWSLLFEAESLNEEKLKEALVIYRKHCYDFNTFDDYNNWISKVRTQVVQNKLQSFWQNVVVDKNLGLCFVSTDTEESKQALKKFYELPCDKIL